MINKVMNQSGLNPINTTASIKQSPAVSQQRFADFLKNSIDHLNKVQGESDIATNKLANGGNIDLHEVMIASQKGSITLQATMEIRNKVVEAYQEVMRMQV